MAQTFLDTKRYMSNLASYHTLYEQHRPVSRTLICATTVSWLQILEGRLKGMVLTGWQRYFHGSPLCELLPVAIPSLVKQAFYLKTWDERRPVSDGYLVSSDCTVIFNSQCSCLEFS